MRVLRVHGGKPKYFHAVIGGNFRLDELQAAVLRVKLRYLDGWTQGRQRNAAYYDSAFAEAGLGPNLSTPLAPAGQRHIFNQYVVRAQNRDALKARLAERGIGSEIYYPVPLHQQKCFAYLNYRAGDFPHSERAAAEVLALPVYPELEQAQLAHVAATVAQFYA
jgi:dTDP-4-amino-4,6-dideoxygalactose transaminase